MKKVFAVLALVCVLAAAGCGNNSSSQTTTAETEKTGKHVTAVAYEAPEKEDTTEEALRYLEQNAPLFRKYLDIRRSVPLIFETSVTTNEGEWKTSVYIKDSRNFAQVSVDPAGAETRVLYMGDTAYQIDSAKKTVYTMSLSEENLSKNFDGISLRVIYLDEVSASKYTNDTAELNGVEYDHVLIASAEGSSEHFFDKSTGALAYTVTESGTTRVDRLESAMPDESVFTIPSDYTRKTFDDLVAEYRASAETSQSE